MSPVVRDDGSGSNTYNIEAISSSDSDSTESDNSEEQQMNSPPHRSNVSLEASNNDVDNGMEDFSDGEGFANQSTSSSSSSSSSSNRSMNNDEPLAGFSPNLEPVNASWTSSSVSSGSNSNSEEAAVIQTDDQDTI